MCVDGLISFPLLSHLLVECECQNVLSPSGKDLLIWIQGSIASLGSSHGQPSPDLAHIVQTYESAGMPCAFRCRLDNPGEQRCSGRILMDFGAENGTPKWSVADWIICPETSIHFRQGSQLRNTPVVDRAFACPVHSNLQHNLRPSDSSLFGSFVLLSCRRFVGFLVEQLQKQIRKSLWKC